MKFFVMYCVLTAISFGIMVFILWDLDFPITYQTPNIFTLIVSFSLVISSSIGAFRHYQHNKRKV